jgi:hypothetical protein
MTGLFSPRPIPDCCFGVVIAFREPDLKSLLDSLKAKAKLEPQAIGSLQAFYLAARCIDKI